MRSSRWWIGCAAVMALSASSPADAAAVRFVSDPATHVDIVVDARPAAQCEKASLPGARCLPLRDLLGPFDRLANISGLLWLLGTAGLTGAEHVLVVGDRALDRDALAGLLYLAGQRQVSVLAKLVSKDETGTSLTPGTGRSTTREAVFEAPMRSGAVVLRGELLALIRSDAPPVILDGRRETEYWGATVRGARGGHVPGAQHSVLSGWSPGTGSGPPVHLAGGARPIVYGHGARDGLAFLARAVARGVEPRAYLEGWAGWASDGSLPADSATYPARHGARLEFAPAATRRFVPTWPVAAALALGGLALAGAGFALGRRSAARAET